MSSGYFEGNVQPEQHFYVGDYDRQVYFEPVDSVTNCIFEHLIKRITQGVQTVSKSSSTVSGKVKGMIHCMMSLISSKKTLKILSLIPEVMSMVKIILVVPTLNASSEHAFSALRRLKSYLSTTM